MIETFPKSLTPPLLNSKELFGDRFGKNLDPAVFCYKLAGSGNRFALDAISDGVMEHDANKMSVWVPYANGNERDGVGDLLEVGGIDTSRHLVNACLLFDHGKAEDVKYATWPIAMAYDPDNNGAYTNEIDVNNRKARINGFFYQGTGLKNIDKKDEYDFAIHCQQIYHLIIKGFFRSGSIGYQIKAAQELPPNYMDGIPKGYHLLAVKMLEASVVIMPANPDTVGKGFDPIREVLCKGNLCGNPLSGILVKSLTPLASEKKAQLGWEGKGLISEEEVRETAKKSYATNPLESRDDYENPLSDGNVPAAAWSPGLGNKNDRLKVLRSKYKATEVPSFDSNRPKWTVVVNGSEMGVTFNSKEEAERYSRRYKKPNAQVSVEMIKKSMTKALNHPTSGKINSFNYVLVQPGERVTARTFISYPRNHPKYSLDYGKGKPFAKTGESLWIVSIGQFDAVCRNKEGDEIKVSHSDIRTNRAIPLDPSWPITSRKSLSDLRKKFRAPARRRLRKSIPGITHLRIQSKDLAEAKKHAESKGIKFQLLGPGDEGLDRVKLIGDDAAADEVAKHWGKSLMNIKSLRAKYKSTAKIGDVPDMTGRERDSISHDTLLNSVGGSEELPGDKDNNGKLPIVKKGKKMKTKTKAMENPEQEGEDLIERDDADTKDIEPYGAQVMRHLHDRSKKALEENEEFTKLLDHDGIAKHLEEDSTHHVGKLDKLEKMWGKEKRYKDLPELEDADAENVDAEMEEPEGKDLAEEETESDSNEELPEVAENPEDIKSFNVKRLERLWKALDDEDDKEEAKRLRRRIKMVEDEEKALGDNEKHKKDTIKRIASQGNILSIADASGIDIEVFSGIDSYKPENREKWKKWISDKNNLLKLAAAIYEARPDMQKSLTKSVCTKCKGTECKCSGKTLPKKGKSFPEEKEADEKVEVTGIKKVKSEFAEHDEATDMANVPHKKFEPHEMEMMHEAKSFMKELAMPGSEFSQEKSMNAYHHGKNLESVVERCKSQIPGDLAWLEEEGNEPEHKGNEVLNEGESKIEGTLENDVEKDLAGNGETPEIDADKLAKIDAASKHLKALSQEKAFGDAHRQACEMHSKAMEFPEENQADETVEITGEMGEKDFPEKKEEEKKLKGKQKGSIPGEEALDEEIGDQNEDGTPKQIFDAKRIKSMRGDLAIAMANLGLNGKH